LASVLLPLLMLLLTVSKKNFFRTLLGISILINAATLLIVNAQIAWWLAIVGSVLTFAFFAMRKKDVFDSRWLVMPILFLALALLFSFFKFSIPGLPDRPAEVSLGQKPSLDLTLKSLQVNPVFGTGPGTFNKVFLKNKD